VTCCSDNTFFVRFILLSGRIEKSSVIVSPENLLLSKSIFLKSERSLMDLTKTFTPSLSISLLARYNSVSEGHLVISVAIYFAPLDVILLSESAR